MNTTTKQKASRVSPVLSQLKRKRLVGQDPWIVPYKNTYLLIQSTKQDTALSIRQFEELDHMIKATEVEIWTPPAGSDHSQMLWAPELHTFPDISDKWYVYYAACDGNNDNHRMYVLESDTSDPMGTYHEIGKVYDPQNDYWAIDLTVFKFKNQLYGVWSGWETEKGDFPQNLYIAKMSNPWTISSERVMISKPEYPWEMSDAAINEGPQVLVNKESIFIVYSADASWTCAYKLGMLKHTGADVLNPSSWIKMSEPIFEQGETQAYGPGHASFITSYKGDSTRNVIVYHCKKSTEHGWEREIRYKDFEWDEKGHPKFGIPD